MVFCSSSDGSDSEGRGSRDQPEWRCSEWRSCSWNAHCEGRSVLAGTGIWNSVRIRKGWFITLFASCILGRWQMIILVWKGAGKHSFFDWCPFARIALCPSPLCCFSFSFAFHSSHYTSNIHPPLFMHLHLQFQANLLYRWVMIQ